jgi:catechol 2,3-dioxygenase-like lactoylglutathione lyase family enzyme
VKLAGAMLFVKDLPRMTAFYADVLGLRPIEATRLPDWVEFHGEAQFSLHAIPAAIAAGISVESPPVVRAQAGTKLTFVVADVEATLATIENSGLPLLNRPWGSIEAVDPEGNVFALRSSATTPRA